MIDETMKGIFDENFKKYDQWYDKNKFAYLCELKLLKKVVPKKKKGLEIGVGTGRFAQKLGTDFGVDPSSNMLRIAQKRGIKTKIAKGEDLPFKDGEFDYVTIIITFCFLDNPDKVLAEVERVLKKNGKIIIAVVDKESFLGKFYQEKKSIFYKKARFFSIPLILELLGKQGFIDFSCYQTIFNLPDKINQIQKPKPGFGEGGFVVIQAKKP